MATCAITQVDMMFYASSGHITIPKGTRVQLVHTADIEPELEVCRKRMNQKDATARQRAVVFTLDGTQRCALLPDEVKPVPAGRTVPRAR